MPRIEAQPAALSGAGGRQADLAGRIGELSGRLASSSSASGAAGDPAASEAISGFLSSWQASLALLSDSVAGLGSNLTAASGAYSGTDEGAIPAGRP